MSKVKRKTSKKKAINKKISKYNVSNISLDGSISIKMLEI